MLQRPRGDRVSPITTTIQARADGLATAPYTSEAKNGTPPKLPTLAALADLPMPQGLNPSTYIDPDH